jgi:general secretion pathway protein G
VNIVPHQHCLRFPKAHRGAGFSLLELALTLTIVGVLTAIAIPAYTAYVERAKIGAAVADISRIELAVAKFTVANDRLPVSLAEIGMNGLLDPWGNAYRYQDFTGLKGVGSMRKDRNLVPINSDYDLYSVGKDGDSRMPLATPVSHDDVIRANDGGYVGKAEDY